MNYDPNLTNSGRMANQTVKLTFGQWDYRAEMVVTVGGNCTGLTVIDAAVGVAFDRLAEEADCPEIVLTKEGGDTLACEDDDDREDEWLKDMLIAAEITSIEPKPEKTP